MTNVALRFGLSLLIALLVSVTIPTSSDAFSGSSPFAASDHSLLVEIKKERKKKAPNCKKAKCDPGEFKLDKPNIYGACCQATAAPLTPKPVAEKCKFPGEVGEPPNCRCPEGTEFMGYKGCIAVKTFRYVCTAQVTPVPIYGNPATYNFSARDDTEALKRTADFLREDKRTRQGPVDCRRK